MSKQEINVQDKSNILSQSSPIINIEHFNADKLVINNIKPYIYDAIENYVIYNNFYLRFKNDIERGINFYHQNNNKIIDSIIKKINKRII